MNDKERPSDQYDISTTKEAVRESYVRAKEVINNHVKSKDRQKYWAALIEIGRQYPDHPISDELADYETIQTVYGTDQPADIPLASDLAKFGAAPQTINNILGQRISDKRLYGIMVRDGFIKKANTMADNQDLSPDTPVSTLQIWDNGAAAASTLNDVIEAIYSNFSCIDDARIIRKTIVAYDRPELFKTVIKNEPLYVRIDLAHGCLKENRTTMMRTVLKTINDEVPAMDEPIKRAIDCSNIDALVAYLDTFSDSDDCATRYALDKNRGQALYKLALNGHVSKDHIKTVRRYLKRRNYLDETVKSALAIGSV